MNKFLVSNLEIGKKEVEIVEHALISFAEIDQKERKAAWEFYVKVIWRKGQKQCISRLELMCF